jgi:serine/threonine protein kinase
MIYEYLDQGDLHSHITQHADTLHWNDFLHYALQIVSGMIYLSSKNFLHNDLSLRNIFVSGYRTVKITNVARYCQQYQHDYYRIANRLLPVRWMAVESLLSGMYSEMSDVWSFGILLWEMFSYGLQPYCGFTNPEVIELIRDKKLLSCPIHCPKRLYALMCACWHEFCEQRPNFVKIKEQLRQWEESMNSSSVRSDGSTAVMPLESLLGRCSTPLESNRTNYAAF